MPSYSISTRDIDDYTNEHAQEGDDWSISDVLDRMAPGRACHQEVEGGVMIFETMTDYEIWSRQV